MAEAARVEGWFTWPTTVREVYPLHTQEVCDRMEERYVSAEYHNPEMNEYDELWADFREDNTFFETMRLFVEHTSQMEQMEDDMTCYEICSSVYNWLAEQEKKYRVFDSVLIMLSLFLLGTSVYNLYKSFSQDDDSWEVESGKSRQNKGQVEIESGKSR